MLFIMFILAGLFVLGKDIKLLRLTPETRDTEAGGWGEVNKRKCGGATEIVKAHTHNCT